MSKIARFGPSVALYKSQSVPAYVEDDTGARFNFNRFAEEKDGGVELSQLAADECVIAPGLIYKRSVLR
jgi:hypothetical protein